jgi:uncharacterized protein YuzE
VPSILRYEYDADADALYVYLFDKAYSYGEELSPERRVDFAADGAPIGVELTCLGEGVSVAGLPAADEIAQLLEELQIRILV